MRPLPRDLSLDPLPRPTTSVVIVSYNVRELLLRCLASIEAADSSTSIQTIVVDNASTDGSVDAVRAGFPNVLLVDATVNRGFGAANNLALAQAHGNQVMFLNPDAELGSDALAELTRALWSEPGVGVVGPQLIFPDGTTQSSRRRFPDIPLALVESTPIQQWWPRFSGLDRYYVRDRSDKDRQEVDWLVGACLLARRAVLDEVGGFDERFFMYSEELDWCRRVRAAGWRVLYCPTARVIHHEGQSSEQNLARRARTFQASKARYFEKYYGSAVGRALRLYLLGLTSIDLLLECAKLVAGHRPELRRQRIVALGSLAREQWRRLPGSAKGDASP
ncbi:MAG TPA: glycosyltransferase family 2 protein [Chloroflexota bacterium]